MTAVLFVGPSSLLGIKSAPVRIHKSDRPASISEKYKYKYYHIELKSLTFASQ